MANEKSDKLSQAINNVQIDIRMIKSGTIYSYDLCDEYGNVMLAAYSELTESLKKHLLAENITHLFYNPGLRKSRPGEAEAAAPGVISDSLRNEALENSRGLLDSIRDNFNYSPESRLTRDRVDKSRGVVNKILDEIDGSKDGMFNPLVKLKSLDEYDYIHSTNVSILGALLASKLDFSREVRAAMGLGGLFHDIGKSSIAKEILHKARLSDEEFDVVKGHPHVGYKVVENNQHMKELEKQIVLLHHERPDGNGYPFGFDYDHMVHKTPREVRLMSLCDVYSALVSERPYGRQHTSMEALRLMLNMVHAPYKATYHFLPNDFRDFIRALGMTLNGGNFFLRPGDLVRLNSGEVAVIEEMNRLYPLNPRIRVVTTKDKQPLKRQIPVDLLKNYASYITNVFEKKAGTEQA
jgi:HD-GYP domain-containing protein (c-di-GMP phosphodiesterase class II)